MFLSFYTSSIFIFYLLFELSVIPVCLFIFSWGSDSMSVLAGFFLFFFTFFSSLLFFWGIFFLLDLYGSFSFVLLSLKSTLLGLDFYFIFMLVVFFVKMPIFLFHIWLPLAHVESPLLGSMVLASLMLSLGGYGIYRLLVIFYMEFFFLKFYFIVWGISGSIIMCIVCFSQCDLKKIVAYSSVSHMSLIMPSLFSYSLFGFSGFLFMMFSHGLLSSVMFYGLGVVYCRYFSRNVFLLSSLLTVVPLCGFWWSLISIFNLGFPPLISFMSEFLMYFSIIFTNVILIWGVFVLFFFTGIYTINMMMMVFGCHGGLHVSVEMNMMEHLGFLVHLLLLTFFFACYWLF